MTDDLREKVEGAATATMRALVDAHVRTWGTIVNQDKVLCGYSVSPEMVRELRSAVSAQVATLLDEQAERLARAEAERARWQESAHERHVMLRAEVEGRNTAEAKLAAAEAVVEAAREWADHRPNAALLANLDAALDALGARESRD